jgi:hypothetical protein
VDIATRSTNSSKRLEGKRDRALLALLLACGLGRHEAVALRLEHLEQREEHWAIVDLKGKGGHVRTVPVPGWVMEELRVWLNAPGIDRGKIFRRVTKMGRLLGEGMSERLSGTSCPTLPRRGRRTGADPVPSGAISPFRRRNGISAASSEPLRRSMTESGSNLAFEGTSVGSEQSQGGSTMAMKPEVDGWITTRTKSTR